MQRLLLTEDRHTRLHTLTTLIRTLYRGGSVSWNPTVNRMTAQALLQLKERDEVEFALAAVSLDSPLPPPTTAPSPPKEKEKIAPVVLDSIAESTDTADISMDIDKHNTNSTHVEPAFVMPAPIPLPRRNPRGVLPPKSAYIPLKSGLISAKSSASNVPWYATKG